MEADNLSELHAGDDTLIYQHNGPFYYGREAAIRPSVMTYSIKDRESKTVVDDVTSWSLTADGKHVLAQLQSKEISMSPTCMVTIGKSCAKNTSRWSTTWATARI